eukprot:GFKZ01006874.1.p1 GENE.GFKZ01006874.1~~GFKZ01006874.1.p1  ORF type:complete len:226 (+),score=5.56 GFKZ01006874.1:1291-1968(+)
MILLSVQCSSHSAEIRLPSQIPFPHSIPSFHPFTQLPPNYKSPLIPSFSPLLPIPAPLVTVFGLADAVRSPFLPVFSPIFLIFSLIFPAFSIFLSVSTIFYSSLIKLITALVLLVPQTSSHLCSCPRNPPSIPKSLSIPFTWKRTSAPFVPHMMANNTCAAVSIGHIFHIEQFLDPFSAICSSYVCAFSSDLFSALELPKETMVTASSETAATFGGGAAKGIAWG